jgi:AcrR family transcriptional regulator
MIVRQEKTMEQLSDGVDKETDEFRLETTKTDRVSMGQKTKISISRSSPGRRVGRTPRLPAGVPSFGVSGVSAPGFAPAVRTGQIDPVRARILKAAEDQFLTNGFSTVTMEDMAVGLGMSKKTMYRHFRSKEQLVKMMLLNRLNRIHRHLEEIHSDPTLDVVTRMKKIVEFLAMRHGEVKQPFFRDLQRHAPDVFKLVDNYRMRAIPALFGKVFEEGRQMGLMRGDIPKELVIESLRVCVQNIINPEVLTRLDMPLRKAFEMILDMLFNGIMTADGKIAYEKIRS